ncbi:MAG TPA: hypothetical protein VMB20_12440 [Candidatus Acidoferrum sp.]|nr:hypothetical protein [Candidatus Acidoferrum sp.]
MIALGSAFLLLGAIGILMNFRMTASRPNPLFAFGNVLFFVGPIVLGIRTIARTLHDLDYFVFGFAIAGIVVMGVGLLLGRRANRT